MFRPDTAGDNRIATSNLPPARYAGDLVQGWPCPAVCLSNIATEEGYDYDLEVSGAAAVATPESEGTARTACTKADL